MKILTIKTQHIIVYIFFILSLAACGGGGSSSGGGSDTVESADGTFNGTVDLTASSPGIDSMTMTAPISFVIQDNTLTSISLDGEAAPISLPLSGNSFTLTESTPMAITFDGISCTGSLVSSGTVSGDTLTGDINGSFSCSMSGVTVPITISGPFTANR